MLNVFRQAADRGGWGGEGDSAEIQLDDGRRQTVYAEHFEDEGEPMLRLASIVGPATAMNEARATAALRLNARHAHGALAIVGDRIAMVDTFVLGKVDVDEVSRSMLYLARRADEYERHFIGTDSH